MMRITKNMQADFIEKGYIVLRGFLSGSALEQMNQKVNLVLLEDGGKISKNSNILKGSHMKFITTVATVVSMGIKLTNIVLEKHIAREKFIQRVSDDINKFSLNITLEDTTIEGWDMKIKNDIIKLGIGDAIIFNGVDNPYSRVDELMKGSITSLTFHYADNRLK
jgi:hypothetical protein